MLRPICLYILFVLLLITGSDGFSQQLKLGKNPSAVIKSAVLELESTNQGLLFPRLTDTASINLFSPPDGMVIYLTTAKQLFVRSNGRWSVLTSGTIDTTSIANFYLKVRNDLNAGTGISYNKATGVITNSAPDQTVGLTAGIGIGVSGTYPNFTITNSAPDQTVALSAGTGISVTGTYPNFTITNNSLSSGGTVTSVTSANGNATITNPTTTPVITIVSAPKLTTARTIQGVSFDGSANISLFNGTGLLRANGTNITYDNNTYLTSVDTTNITNFSQKVRGLFGATSPLAFNAATGVFSMTQASSTTAGYLSVADWNTFNNKLSSITQGNLTEAGSGVLTITGGSNAVIGSGTSIQVKQASGSQGGFLSSGDWTTFNNKQTALNGTGLVRANGTTITYDNNTYLTSVDTTNISNFYLKVRNDLNAGTGITYNKNTGVITNAGVTSLNGNVGALTMDTGYISNFYVKTRSLFSGTAPVTYNNTTGVIGISQASGTTDGYLSAADWTTFNNKLSSNNVWTRQGNAGTNPGTDFIGTTDAKDLIFKTQGIERWRIENSTGDIKIGSATSGTFKATQELVMRQDGDTYGSSILRLRNRNAENGAIFETTDPTTTLVDFIFKTATSQRNIRYEGRNTSPYNLVGIPAFHIGGSNPDLPNLAIGDNYSAFSNKLKIGSYATATEVLDVVGNVKFSGALMPNNTAGTSGQFLQSNGAGNAPTWVTISSSGSGWSLTGNSGTTPGTNFIGTTDNKDLVFKMNSNQVGKLEATNVSFGSSAQVQGGTNSLAIGSSAYISANNSIAIGNTAQVQTGTESIAIGKSSYVSTTNSIAIGNTAQVQTGSEGISIGKNSYVSATNGIAIGNTAQAQGASTIAIGQSAYGAGTSSLALGKSASTGSYNNATAIGVNATVGQNDAIVLGDVNNSSLKIGIGTNTPSQKLDVVGNVEFSGALMPNNIAGTSGQFLQSNGANTAPTWVSATNVISDDYVFSYGTGNKAFTSAGNWADITVNGGNGQISGWTHSTSSNSQNFTCNQTGVYQISYTGQVNNSSTTVRELAMRAVLDGTEIVGSVNAVECSSSFNATLSNTFLVSITSGQVLKLQLTGSNTSIQLAANSSYGTTKPSISVTIIRIK